jgi:TP901 family phage tail tape measure protein
MADVAGEVKVLVTMDAAAAQRSAAGLQTTLGKVGVTAGQSAKEADAKFKEAFASIAKGAVVLGGALTLAFTRPIVNFGKESVGMAMSYDTTMRQVQAATEASAEEMDVMRQTCIDMGMDSVFSVNELGGAMLELAKSGLTPAQIRAGALRSSMLLATAGGLGLAEAADAAMSTMSIFGLEVEDTAFIVDTLTAAADASRASVADISRAMEIGAPMANNLGYSVGDAAAAFAMLADHGIKGSMAGTTFRSAMQHILDMAPEATALMEELGMSFINADGSMKGLDEIAGILQTSFADLTDSQRAAYAETLFGAYGLNFASALMEEGEEGMRGYIDAVDDCGGAADKMAKAITDGPEGSLLKMNAAIDAAKLAVGEMLMPLIADIADAVTAVVKAFVDLPEPVQGVVLGVLAIVAAIGPLLAIFGTIGMALPGIQAGMAALGVVFGAISAPVLIIVGVIAALVAAFLYFWNTSAGFRDFFIGMWEKLKDAVSKTVDSIKGRFDALKERMEPVLERLRDALSKFEPVITLIATVIGGVLVAAFGIVVGLFEGFVNALAGVVQFVTGVIGVIGGIIDIIVGFFTGDPARMEEGFKTILLGIFDTVTGFFSTIVGFFAGFIQGIIDFFTNLYDELVGHSIIPDMMNAIAGWFEALIGFVTAPLQAIWDFIVDCWEAISEAVSGAVEFVVGLFTPSPFEALQKAADGARQYMHNVFQRIQSNVSDAIEGVKAFLADPFAPLRKAAEAVMQWVKDKFKIEIPPIKLPHFKLSGEFSLMPPSVPRLSIEWYAKGGIFNGPSIIGVGERGSEAVLPLTAKGLAPFAEALAGAGGGDVTNIYIGDIKVDSDSRVGQMLKELVGEWDMQWRMG